MTVTRLIVNGRAVSADIDGRTHLADFLRDHLRLTGTHIGCEHGVCGACTLVLDGDTVRSCITFPALCDGAEICTIEGFENDSVMIRLREAFSAEHALQCGYCTPGMLITARDIVTRLPDADDDRIRLELAGNLCRCTGYNGIVRAIRRVLDERLPLASHRQAAIPSARFEVVAAAPVEAARAVANTDGLHQRLRFAMPAEILWNALQDPALVASSIPGATVRSVDGDTVDGEMLVALGPVRVRFTGQARLAYDQPNRSGTVRGSGNDRASGTRVTGDVALRVVEDGATSCRLAIDVSYEVRGPLSQLARGRVVDLMAGEIAASFATALSARLRGEAAPAMAPLSAGGLILRIVKRWLRGLFGRA